MNRRSLYLQVGDHVFHKKYAQWGVGEVVEEWNSALTGGRCFVRVAFQYKKTRVFDNDVKSLLCSYYGGLMQVDAGD